MNFDLNSITEYLHLHIPLTRAMQIELVRVTDKTVEVRAPLMPNINHRATAFGGSVSALAIVAAWTLLHLQLRELGMQRRIVIQKCKMDFSKPVLDDFCATSALPSKDVWERFLTTLARRNRARINLKSVLSCRSISVGIFEGAYVVMPEQE